MRVPRQRILGFALALLNAVVFAQSRSDPEKVLSPVPEVARLMLLAEDPNVDNVHSIPLFANAAVLAIQRRDEVGLGRALMWEASCEDDPARVGRALKLFHDAEATARKCADIYGLVRILDFRARALIRVRRVAEARVDLRKASELIDRLTDAPERAIACYWAANSALSAGDQELARRLCDRAASAVPQMGDLAGRGQVEAGIAGVFEALGRYDLALSHYVNGADALNGGSKFALLGECAAGAAHIRMRFGDFRRARDLYSRAADAYERASDEKQLANALRLLGVCEYRLGDYAAALPRMRRAIDIQTKRHATNDLANTWNDTGLIFDNMGWRRTALKYYQRSFAVKREFGAPQDLGTVMGNIADALAHLHVWKDAIRSYRQAIAYQAQVSDYDSQARPLMGLARLYEPGYKRPEANSVIAVFYAKKAINLYQRARQNIADQSAEIRDSYKQSVADNYRFLADQLVALGRIPEAEHVLRLIKDDELYEYVRRTEPITKDASIAFTAEEAKWDREYEVRTRGIASVAREASEIRALTERTPEQTQRLVALRQELERAESDFSTFMDRTLQVARALKVGANRLERVGSAEGVERVLNRLPAGTVAVYALAAPDRLRLVFVAPGVSRAHAVPVTLDELNKLIGAWRNTLSTPQSDPRARAKELYDVLIKPIEEDLAGSHAKTIMWSLDGPLRYIPIAALWDGQRYVLEKWGTCLFDLSAGNTFDPKHASTWRAVAAGVSKGRTLRTASGAEMTFSPLPGVRQELDTVANAFPSTVKMMDEAFTLDSFKNALDAGPDLVHLATHFAFSAGDETKSFLLTGDGPPLRISDARALSTLSLQGVSLLTLSACETGLGGTFADGSEVESISAILQRKGAEAIVTSLWAVADDSTKILMQNFYGLRRSHVEWSTEECLRQAQLTLLRSAKRENPSASRSGLGAPDASAPAPLPGYAHPYYWAPFVLTGDWR
jgi:CHAT domain-containing protein